MTLFGLPFFAAGVFLILSGLGVITFAQSHGHDWWADVVLAIMGLIFGSVGGALVFGRTWVTIDRGAGTVLTAYGLLVPMKYTSRSLREFNQVGLDFSRNSSRSSGLYRVSLRSPESKPVNVSSSSDYSRAYAEAVSLAQFLSFSLRDNTSNTTKTIAASDLAAPFLKRFQSPDSDKGYATRPIELKSAVEQSSHELKITTSAPAVGWWQYVPVLAMLGFAAYYLPRLAAAHSQAGTPENVQWMLYGIIFLFISLPVSNLLFALLRSRFGYTRLTVTSDAITLSEHKLIGERSKSIPLADIIDVTFTNKQKEMDEASEEFLAERKPPQATFPSLPGQSNAERIAKWIVEVVPSEGIKFRTKHGLVTFGSGLPNDEAAYLHRLIREQLQRV